VDCLELPKRGLLFPAPLGGHIRLHNWRARFWFPALEASGLPYLRPYAMRHTYAAWSLAAGIGIFSLARRMGTSVEMINATYGHLVHDADLLELDILDAWDNGR
jgi:integrase